MNNFIFFKKIVHKYLGVDLEMSDETRNIGKMNNFLKSLNITNNLEEYYRALTTDEEKEEFKKNLIDIVTINETSFFRDKIPFEYIRSLLDGKTKLDVLSIPCSFGQEVYSLAILFEENNFKSYQIYGVDISSEVVDYARRGQYNTFEISRGISEDMQNKYFIKDEKKFDVSPKIRSKVSFSVGSVLDRNVFINSVDLILCRNLLIYFNDKTRETVILNLLNSLKKGGKLILGGGERVSHPSLLVEYYSGMPVYTKI
ncbi:protein-glutamate O-methyltransferase CheR [Bacteriovorax sp. Seq25_V]|uniref:CheR family methyltransferase n=1 Tax=Bacteriovorax sp. Seq25_V TaxID=1201288 RepID=UPI00054EC59F|nr:CheR family methyltransferase [Bacteriovorax sp. Seq25_V]